MPNIKSVKKDVLRSRVRRLRNQAVKSRIKTFVKKANALMASGEASEAVPDMVSQTISVVDKAAKHGIIHKNAAARRKSRLMRRAYQVANAPA